MSSVLITLTLGSHSPGAANFAIVTVFVFANISVALFVLHYYIFVLQLLLKCRFVVPTINIFNEIMRLINVSAKMNVINESLFFLING